MYILINALQPYQENQKMREVTTPQAGDRTRAWPRLDYLFLSLSGAVTLAGCTGGKRFARISSRLLLKSRCINQTTCKPASSCTPLCALLGCSTFTFSHTTVHRESIKKHKQSNPEILAATKKSTSFMSLAQSLRFFFFGERNWITSQEVAKRQ